MVCGWRCIMMCNVVALISIIVLGNKISANVKPHQMINVLRTLFPCPAGAQCRERHWGSERVWTRDGKGVPSGQEECPKGQSTRHCAWGYCWSCRWVHLKGSNLLLVLKKGLCKGVSHLCNIAKIRITLTDAEKLVHAYVASIVPHCSESFSFVPDIIQGKLILILGWGNLYIAAPHPSIFEELC